MNNLMDTNIKILAIALVAISIAVAPSLVVNKSVDAATHYCADEIGKSNAWIEGCKQGWFDHNHCKSYNPGTGEVAKGYKVGWNKGECKSSPQYCTEYSGKSQNWIKGCQQGWWDHNHCWGYSPGSGDYAKGYSVGWTKGHCN